MKRSKFIVLPLALAAWACAGPPPPQLPALPMAPPPVAQTDESAKPDRASLPRSTAARKWAPPPVTTWTMANGMDVWYLQQDQAPLVSLSLVFDRGSSTDPAEKAGLTALMADMLDEGAGARSALELSDAFQRLATDYSAYTQQDGVLLSLHMLSDQLAPSLELLSDVARRPKLSKEEFERRRDLLAARAVTNQAELDETRDLVVERTLFGEGYGGTASYGVPSTLKRIKLADVKASYQGIIKPKGATVIVVGSIDEQTLRAALEKSFGDWRGEPSAMLKPVSSTSPEPGIYLVDFPDSTQSSVALVKRAEGASAEDYFPAAVFNWALGGAFTSRLNLNLREDKGYTYGARSSFDRDREAGIFGMFAQVKADTTGATINEMFREASAMNSTEPLTEEELNDAVSAMLLGFPSRFERLSGVGFQLAHLKLTGRDANWYRSYADQLAAVTLPLAEASAKRHTTTNDFVAVVAGPLKTIEPSLKEIGKPLFHCDHEGTCGSARLRENAIGEGAK